MSPRNWSPEVVHIGDRIAALTLARAAQLAEYLEQVHRLCVAATRAVTERTPEEDRPVVVPPSEFDVCLEAFEPARKIMVIKAVRELTTCGLKEARDLVEGAPKVVKERLPPAEAEALRVRLEAAGATVSLRPSA